MKSLIIYYSRRGQNYVNGSVKNLVKGNAELIAEFIRNAVDADVFEVDTVKPYDEDYMVCIEEAKAELRAKARPALKEMLGDVSAYDTIFAVGPNWWGAKIGESLAVHGGSAPASRAQVEAWAKRAVQ